MRWAALLLALGMASGARGQESVIYSYGPECADAESLRITASGVARAPEADAVSTDGFGLRIQGTSGRRPDLGAGSLLTDADLAWRLSANGASAFECPDLRPTGLLRDGPLGLALHVEAGNEVGDPGPLRYLDPSLPNVDKIGPDYEATLRLPRAVVSARWRDFIPTDPALAPRVFDASGGRFPKRKGLALGASGVPFDGLRLTAEGLVAEDLPFEETLGREVPVLRRRAGVRADVRASGGWSGHAVARGEALLRPSWSLLDAGARLGPDWREGVAEVGVERWLLVDSSETMTLNARLRQRVVSGPGVLDGSVTTAALSMRRGFFKGRAVVGSSGVGAEASGDLWRHRRGYAETTLRAYVRRVLPEEAPGLSFWVARGYFGLSDRATPLLLDGAPVPENRGTVEGKWSRSWDWKSATLPRIYRPRSGTSISAEIDAVQGETVLLPDFVLAPEAVAVEGPVRVVEASGGLLRAKANTWWTRRERGAVYSGAETWLSAWAAAQIVVRGDAAFRAARDREPTFRVGAHAEHSPDGLLRLSARLEWRAATRWDGWPEPDVPAALLLDLGLSRRLGLLDVSITGRNVLGAPEQTHPLGATLDGRLFVRLEARF